MRKLILLRGIQGSGKSTYIKENNLEKYTLSSDTIRMMYSNIKQTLDGFVINGDNDDLVWQTLFSMLETRMKNGDFTIIDSTNINRKSINKYIEMAKKYNYEIYYKDFDISLEEALDRNKSIEYFRSVTENVIERFYKNKKEAKMRKEIIEIKDIRDLLNVDIRNVDNFNQIKVIGDIHGCYDVLMKALDNKIDEDTLYIFTGNYFDRGLQNAEVFTFIKKIFALDNVVLIKGNHELHIESYINEKEYKKEFAKTINEIKTKLNIDDVELKKEFSKIQKVLVPYFSFEFNNKKYFLSHAGLPFIPKEFSLVNEKSMIKGAGGYDCNLTDIYDKNYEKGFYINFIQIYGHRNMPQGKYSYCLESGVERNGSLSVVNITKDGGELKNVR